MAAALRDKCRRSRAATCLIETRSGSAHTPGMIRAPIANAVVASIVVAEILGALMLLLQR